MEDKERERDIDIGREWWRQGGRARERERVRERKGFLFVVMLRPSKIYSHIRTHTDL